jgi:hypothetical protein
MLPFLLPSPINTPTESILPGPAPAARAMLLLQSSTNWLFTSAAALRTSSVIVNGLEMTSS